MNSKKKILVRSTGLAIGALIVALLPLVLYRQVFGGAPILSPAQAMRYLARSGALLVDVRSPGEYEKSHLEEAVNWPLEKILSMPGVSALPEWARDQKLLLICTSGASSARAARHLRAIGQDSVYTMSGGMQMWTAVAGEAEVSRFCLMHAAAGKAAHLPEKPLSLVEQVAMVAVGFAIKPSYMLLALILVLILHFRSARNPDLTALKCALAAFFTGEAACSINSFVAAGLSPFWEYLHSLGMVLSFALCTFTLFEALDQRLLHFSAIEQHCAAIGLCRRCFKTAEVTCRLSWLFLFISLAGVVLTFIPLTAQVKHAAYNSRIFGTFYHFSNPLVSQLFEIRFCPTMALLFFLLAFVVLVRHRQTPAYLSKIFFAAGAGYLGFSFFRLFLYQPYADNQVWFIFWEEATEWLYVAGVAIILWLFRATLFPGKRAREIPSSR